MRRTRSSIGATPRAESPDCRIETVDLDGKLFDVAQYLPTACNDVFAMVGGGSTFDSLQLEGPNNLKSCGQLDVPGFTVTKEKTAATDTYFAPIPNPVSTRPSTFYRFLKREYPEESKDIAIAYGDIDTIRFVMDQNVAVMNEGGWIHGR